MYVLVDVEAWHQYGSVDDHTARSIQPHGDIVGARGDGMAMGYLICGHG